MIVIRCLIGRSSGLDKTKLEVYLVIVGLYYGLNVDYATDIWEEFGTSISHTNLTNGVPSARFWGLILQEVYHQEDILVLSDVKTVEFPVMAAPHIFVDDHAIFPNVARILDAILKLVDPDLESLCPSSEGIKLKH